VKSSTHNNGHPPHHENERGLSHAQDRHRSAALAGAEGVISGEAGVCSLVPSAAAALNSLSRAPSGQAKLAQVLIGEIAKHVGIDRIVAKRLRVLLQTDPAERTR
jgi:hypothetical protein